MHTGEGAKSVSYEMDLDFSSGVGGASVFGKTNANNLPVSTLSHLSTASTASHMVNSKAPAKAAGSPDIIDFDLSALSLDLNSAVPLHSPTTAVPPADPWATKLALAKEFQSIGDLDSARKMVQEVINGAGETVKAEAKKVLANLA
jgi:pilus assembly protein FimV